MTNEVVKTKGKKKLHKNCHLKVNGMYFQVN